MTNDSNNYSIAHTAGQVPLGGFRGIYYAGSYVYEDGNLQYQLFSEDRKLYNSDDNTWQYEYHLKDHLGNVRVVFEPERVPASARRVAKIGGATIGAANLAKSAMNYIVKKKKE